MPDVEIGSVGSVDVLHDTLVKSVGLTPNSGSQKCRSDPQLELGYGTRMGIFSVIS
jgi:hypothetical protein